MTWMQTKISRTTKRRSEPRRKVTEMAKDLNKVMIIGRLGKDPEMRYTAGGSPVTTFSVAAGRQWKDSGGETREVLPELKPIVVLISRRRHEQRDAESESG